MTNRTKHALEWLLIYIAATGIIIGMIIKERRTR